MTLIKWNTSQVIGAISGTILFFSPALADRGGVLRWVPVITGGGLWLTLPSRTHSREEDDDFMAYLKAGWDFYTTEVVKEVKEIVADISPPAVQRWVDNMASSFADPLDLFRQLHDKSFLLVAETGGGKTWLMHQSVLFATDTKDKFLVLDKSYGKRGMVWWGLPVNKQVFLFGPDNAQNLPDVLHSAYEERNRRKFLIEKAAQEGKHIPEFEKYRLYITEWNQTQAAYNEYRAQMVQDAPKEGEADIPLPPIERLNFWVSELLFDGHGYNMFLGLDVQSAAVGRSKIDQSQQSQVNWLLMGATAIKQTEVQKLIPNSAEWVSKVLAARSLPGMQRAGIAIIDGRPYLYNPVPYAEGLVLPEETKQLNEVESWLELRKPEIITLLQNRENPSPSWCYDQIKDSFPRSHKNRREDNQYWLALKAFVNQYKQEQGRV